MRERKPNRLQNYDYSKNNLYFVTSCVHGRVCCLGDVSDGKMNLNAYGRIAHEQFEWLPKQYWYVFVHEFVIMPDHVHAIIEINRNFRRDDGKCRDMEWTGRDMGGTGRDLSLPNDVTDQFPNGVNDQFANNVTDQSQNAVANSSPNPSNKIKSLSELMGAYKTTVSKQIHLAGLPEFKWQRSFHDRIIRNFTAYGNIMNYIVRNPEKWKSNDIYKDVD